MRFHFKWDWRQSNIILAVVALLAFVPAKELRAQTAPGPSSAAELSRTRQTISPSPASSSGLAPSSPLLGSVPQGVATREELPLSLQESITRGLRYNLGAVLSGQEARAVRSARLLALSSLLPNLSAQVSQVSQQINLAALGFTDFPGIRQIIGPFPVSDARAYLFQPLLNFASIRNYQAAGQETKAADFSNLDTREMVVVVVANLYLQALAGNSRIEAALAQVASAEAIYKQAVDFKQAGVVPAIEVLRAQVQLQTERQRLIFLRNEFEKEKLRVARAIGLPDGQAIRLADAASYTPMPVLTLEEGLVRAREGRMDYQSALARLRAAEFRERSAHAGHLPSLNFAGNYGVIGQSFSSSHGTYTAALSLNIPIFLGKRVQAEIQEAQAQAEQRRAQLEDLKGRIAFEVRSAFLDLKAANDQAQVAQSAVTLVQQQLTQSRDRFAAGVTSNLEVVQAQEAVAMANENYISSLYAYNAAKAALAKALGSAEKSIPSILLGGTP
jgi:outer membrane protein TolC